MVRANDHDRIVGMQVVDVQKALVPMVLIALELPEHLKWTFTIFRYLFGMPLAPMTTVALVSAFLATLVLATDAFQLNRIDSPTKLLLSASASGWEPPGQRGRDLLH